MDVGCLVGKTFYSFTGRDGGLVEGWRFHCTLNAPVNDRNFVGVQVAIFNVSLRQYDVWKKAGAFIPDVDEACVIRYNRYGRIDQFEAVP